MIAIPESPRPSCDSPPEPFGIGGWIVVFLVIQGTAALVRLLTLGDVVLDFSSAHDAFRMRFSLAGQLNWLETISHVTQFVAPGIGIALTLRIDRREPLWLPPIWWMGFLAFLIAYAFLDSLGWAILQRQVLTALDATPESRDVSGLMARRVIENTFVATWGLIGLVYWSHSKRVRNTFGVGGLSPVEAFVRDAHMTSQLRPS
jgi:hypothetical protein